MSLSVTPDGVAVAVTLLSMLLIGRPDARQQRAGLWLNLIACVLWGYVGLTAGVAGLVIQNVVLAAINLFNLVTFARSRSVKA